MKRTELEVGAVLMHHASHDWENYPGSASTVTVLAVEPHAVVTGYRGMRGDSEPKAVEKGPGVLVERYGERKVVQLRHLRGPWVPCRDEQDRRAKVLRENGERLMRQRSLTRNTALMAADRGATWGVFARPGSSDERAEVVLSAAAFTAMLAALPATWRYSP